MTALFLVLLAVALVLAVVCVLRDGMRRMDAALYRDDAPDRDGEAMAFGDWFREECRRERERVDMRLRADELVAGTDWSALEKRLNLKEQSK